LLTGCLLALAVAVAAAPARAANKAPTADQRSRAPSQQLLSDAAAEGKHVFVMFYRQEDRATRAMESGVDAAIRRRGDKAVWAKIQVTDPAQQELVARYDASRSPMPTLMALAPNGAVTGVFPLKVEDRQFDGAIVTPACADMLKALQQQKITVVCLQPAGWTDVPQGVLDFEADPHFVGRTHATLVRGDDPEEAKFFERIRGNRAMAGPLVAIFAPPGVHVGTYDGKITAQQISKAIHDAGRCGPNCKHHHH
jgi:hypothetical protein